MSATAQKAYITHIERVDSSTILVRYGCRDRGVFEEIKDAIKYWPPTFRRWDPYAFDDKGGWEIDTDIVPDIIDFFVTWPDDMK